MSSSRICKEKRRLEKSKGNGRHQIHAAHVLGVPRDALLLAVEFIEHVVVAFDTLFPSVMDVVRVAKHLVDFHAAASILSVL